MRKREKAAGKGKEEEEEGEERKKESFDSLCTHDGGIKVANIPGTAFVKVA